MKGLLIKDYYMMMRYCRTFFLIVIAFEAAAAFLSDGVFLIAYPLIICSAIPMNLLSYDEKSRWTLYSCTMPYSRGQIVSVKYIYALIMCFVCVVLTVAAQLIGAAAGGGSFSVNPGILAMMLIPVGLIPAAILLPVIFWLGTEKGRIAFYAVIVIVCAFFGFLGADSLDTGSSAIASLAMRPQMLLGADLITLALFGISWAAAIGLYQKREF